MTKISEINLKKGKHPFFSALKQMVGRLRINLDDFGGFDVCEEGIWKSPLPEFIRIAYEKRFGKKFSKKDDFL